ncbi:MAG: DUF4199 domain-containing protein [Saprospiraceae bacterium]|jgi:hypothetical protein
MENPSKMNLALKWGGIMGVVLIVVSLLLYLAGMTDIESGESNWIGTLLNYTVSIGAIYMAVAEYKKLNRDKLSIGDATVIGILAGIIGGLFMALYTYVFMTMIAPEMLDAIRDQAMAGAGDMSNDQEEQMADMMDMFVSPGFMTAMTVIMKFFLGLIVGFILGLVMKNENVNTILEDID